MPFTSHRFPDLDAPLAKSLPEDGKESPSFSPLFSGAASVFSPKGMDTEAPSDEVAQNDAAKILECKKVFSEGMEAGRIEGAELVRKELAPDLANFMEAPPRLSDQMIQLAADTSNQAAMLSLAITQSILGPDIQLSENFLAPLLSNLQHALRDAYHATIHLPSADLNVLNEVVQADVSKQFARLSGITIAADARLAGGRLRIDHDGLDSQSLIDQTLSELTDLLENLPSFDQ